MAARRKTTKKAVRKTAKRTTRKTARKVATRKPVARPPLKKAPKKGVKLALAIAGLVINVAILPGLGSLIAGKIRTGVLQLIFLLLGFLLTITVVGAILGIPLMIAIWVWSIVTGIKAIQEAA